MRQGVSISPSAGTLTSKPRAHSGTTQTLQQGKWGLMLIGLAHVVTMINLGLKKALIIYAIKLLLFKRRKKEKTPSGQYQSNPPILMSSFKVAMSSFKVVKNTWVALALYFICPASLVVWSSTL